MGAAKMSRANLSERMMMPMFYSPGTISMGSSASEPTSSRQEICDSGTFLTLLESILLMYDVSCEREDEEEWR